MEECVELNWTICVHSLDWDSPGWVKCLARRRLVWGGQYRTKLGCPCTCSSCTRLDANVLVQTTNCGTNEIVHSEEHSLTGSVSGSARESSEPFATTWAGK